VEQGHALSFSIKLQEKDLIKYNFSYLYGRWIFSSITAWIFIVGCFAVARGVIEGFSHVPVLSLVFPFIFVIVIPVSLYMGAKRSFKNRLFQEEKIYHIDFQGIQTKSESIQANYRWEDFKETRLTKKAIYLFLTSNSALLFPKDSIQFASFEALKSLILEKVPKRKRNRLGLVVIIPITFLVIVGVLRFISASR
jgi:hypothetical protein